jgi:membrane-associated phospholipid phosphatase
MASFALVGALYLLSSQFHVGKAVRLRWLALDEAVPFLPWTVWIYLSAFVYLPVALHLNRSTLNLNRRLYAFVALGVVSAAIFFLVPSVYPRELYPLPEGVDAASRWLMETVRAVDRPDNCAPSLHVSLATLVALGFLDDRREVFPWIAAWAGLQSLSTLTTKQHHVLDVVSGLVFGALFYFFFHRVIEVSDGRASDSPSTRSGAS